MYKWSIWQPLRIQYTNDKSAIKMSIQKFWTPPLLDPTDYIKSATNLIIDSKIRLHKCVFTSKTGCAGMHWIQNWQEKNVKSIQKIQQINFWMRVLTSPGLIIEEFVQLTKIHQIEKVVLFSLFMGSRTGPLLQQIHNMNEISKLTCIGIDRTNAKQIGNRKPWGRGK